MWNAWKQILVGIASPVSKILLAFKNVQISLSDHELYSPWGSKNKLAQKIHASRGRYGIHVHQMWWLTAPYCSISYEDNKYTTQNYAYKLPVAYKCLNIHVLISRYIYYHINLKTHLLCQVSLQLCKHDSYSDWSLPLTAVCSSED